MMKKILLSIVIFISLGANASVDNVDEVLVCDQCNELHMEIIAQAYGIQNVTAGSRDVMVYSPSDGMFREFVVTPLNIDVFLGTSGSGSNAQMEPLRYNQARAENDLREAFEATKSLKAEVDSIKGEIFNFGSNRVFGSAADALRNPREAAATVTDYFRNLGTFTRHQIQQQNAMNRTGFSLTLQTRIASIQSNFDKGIKTNGIIGFGDGTSWWVELTLEAVAGEVHIIAKPTEMAFFAGGFARIPLSEDGIKFTEDALQFNHGLADLA